MNYSAFNIVIDAQYGSTGKGLISTALAWKYRPKVITTTNMANAGHTAVNDDGDTYIAKALPTPAILNKWIPNYNPIVMVGPSAAFHIEQMLKEIDITNTRDNILIHPRAGVITKEHAEAENDLATGTKHIASTMQGCGAFLADKVMRRPGLKLAVDYNELRDFILTEDRANKLLKAEIKSGFMPEILSILMKWPYNFTMLHEGSQGFGLDINHGSHYPYCTSRSTTAMQNAADMGISHKDIGKVYAVIRPFPIRVGNVVEDGKTVGYSGDCYPDQHEITWEDVGKECGAPKETFKGELTTVTKRLRRVFTFSKMQLRHAVTVNGVTDIALNFANYIDWSCYGTNDPDKLPQKVRDFISMVEDVSGVKVSVVGTGPKINHVCFLR